MTREKRKDLFESIGIVAIVASLIFLTLETRTNTASVRATAYQTWVSVNAELNTMDEELSATVAAGIQNSANLTEESFIRFALWHYTFMQMALATDYMYKMGTIDQDLWETEINRAAGHLDLPGSAAGREPSTSPSRIEKKVLPNSLRWNTTSPISRCRISESKRNSRS